MDGPKTYFIARFDVSQSWCLVIFFILFLSVSVVWLAFLVQSVNINFASILNRSSGKYPQVCQVTHLTCIFCFKFFLSQM